MKQKYIKPSAELHCVTNNSPMIMMSLNDSPAVKSSGQMSKESFSFDGTDNNDDYEDVDY